MRPSSGVAVMDLFPRSVSFQSRFISDIAGKAQARKERLVPGRRDASRLEVLLYDVLEEFIA